jgi:hypothetical protein
MMDIVQKGYPDIRRTINVLQENTIDGNYWIKNGFIRRCIQIDIEDYMLETGY